jgi:hypothetical protein
MATDGKSVDDAAFAWIAAVFTAQEIMELSTLCGYYIGNCRCLNALDLIPESDLRPPYDSRSGLLRSRDF